MAKNKNAASFFDSADDDFINESIKGMSPLGGIYGAAQAPSRPAKVQAKAQPKPSMPIIAGSSPSVNDALDKKINMLAAQLEEKNRKIEELEYKLANQINKNYENRKTEHSCENTYTELHKKEILENILQDIKGLYSSVSTRAKVVEDREYQILLKMVELEQRQRELKNSARRRASLNRKSPILHSYEEYAEEKLVPSDEPALAKNINRAIDNCEKQLKKTPYIALAHDAAPEASEQTRTARSSVKAPKTKREHKPTPLFDSMPDVDSQKEKNRVSTPRVQSLREALASQTAGLDIFVGEDAAQKARSGSAKTEIKPPSVKPKEIHPSREIKREYEMAKAELLKKQQKDAASMPVKPSADKPSDNIEMNDLLDEINKVLGEQHVIENKLNDALKKNAAAHRPAADEDAAKPMAQEPIQSTKTPEVPAAEAKPQTKAKTQEAAKPVKSETMEIGGEDLSQISSLLDDL